MNISAVELLIDTVHEWAVDIIFWLPGDAIRFTQVRHEETAVFMACAYAKYTGKLGVCLATSGPGGIHLLNGL